MVRLGHGLDTSHPVHQAMEHMAERLRVYSKGRMRIDIYPSEQLGSERECIELLQIGSLGMTKVSASVMEGFAPSFKVLTLPYVFRDTAHFWAVLEGPIGKELLRSAEPYRLRGLAYYDAGSRSLYTRGRPVRTPADLDGLKIRTQESATAMSLVAALGGAPTPIAWGELYTALQQGVVDGAENNPPSYYLSRHYEVARFYTLDEHTAVPDVLLISTRVWQRLSAEERTWLEAASLSSARFQRAIWRTATEEALAAVQKAGVTVIRPDKQPFRSRMTELYARLRHAEPEIYRLVEQIEAVSSEADP